jgi:hypothetical protein
MKDPQQYFLCPQKTPHPRIYGVFSLLPGHLLPKSVDALVPPEKLEVVVASGSAENKKVDSANNVQQT